MNDYLEGKDISVEDLKRCIRKAVRTNAFVPIICGSAFKNKGVQAMLDAVIAYLPCPLDLPPIIGTNPDTEKEEVREPKSDQPFTA